MAALAGSLVGLDLNFTPSIGMNAMFMGVIAVVIGGTANALGAALGALLLGMAQQLGAWGLGVGWQDVTVFGALVFFLMLRPYGFFGRPLKSVRV
jgi:branched-chain amino acid transport system permease protein